MKDAFKVISVLAMALLAACTGSENEFDATGTFEAEETIISSEIAGVLREFTVDEGLQLKEGEYVGYVDTVQLHLRKKQLEAQAEAVLSRKPDIAAQLAALNEQLKAAEREQERIKNLLESDAATTKQLDDINAEIRVVKGNIRATRTGLVINTQSIDKEIGPVEAQIEQLEDQIIRSVLKSPLQGTVLTAYAEQYEQVSTGMPLFRIADLSLMTLRAYITGNQLPKVQLDQKVKVLTDDGDGGYHETEGTIYWISDKAEFTPKTVQTKDERANKVYAIKVRVENDGRYKIGMYGEVNF